MIRELTLQRLTNGLIRKATLRDVLPTLLTLLSSKDSDESISEQVLEVIGFDDIDLVTEILADRANMARAVSTHDILALYTVFIID